MTLSSGQRGAPVHSWPYLFAAALCYAVCACTAQGIVLEAAGDSTEPLSFSTGAEHTCMVRSGIVYCWGRNTVGQLGRAASERETSPLPVGNSWQASNVTVGERHSCALSSTGRVYCWGGNDHGQLGDGQRTDRSEPGLVALPSPATSVSTRFNHTCVVLDDSSAHCWGANFEGQLGQGGIGAAEDDGSLDALSPAPLSGRYVSVATGQGHSCGVRIDGTLWCWGRNTAHQTSGGPEDQLRL
ncbi:MAG TPA: hypothetical protein VFQ61_36955, partial [Polyangiaceae bacterium]|nr:hypothetical protein [Polyangiaceae bacterium]